MSSAHTQPAPGAYLRTKVLTASPQELRLMLYEGAVKFCRQARHAVAKSDFEGMYHAIVRAQNIVLELSTSLNHDADGELCRRLAALYNYIYLRLVDANMERDPAAIDEAIRLLDFQRETWTMALRKLEDEKAAPPAHPGSPAVLASIGPRPAGGFSVQG